MGRQRRSVGVLFGADRPRRAAGPEKDGGRFGGDSEEDGRHQQVMRATYIGDGCACINGHRTRVPNGGMAYGVGWAAGSV
jgi:hypothetical protein